MSELSAASGSPEPQKGCPQAATLPPLLLHSPGPAGARQSCGPARTDGECVASLGMTQGQRSLPRMVTELRGTLRRWQRCNLRCSCCPHWCGRRASCL